MLYYMELDPSKEFLEINEVKNIDRLSKIMKVSWGDLNYYLNGDDKPVERLPSGMIVPFIKRNGKVYIISYFKEIIEGKNYSYMSRNILKEVEHGLKYEKIKPRYIKEKKEEVVDNKVDTSCIREPKFIKKEGIDKYDRKD